MDEKRVSANGFTSGYDLATLPGGHFLHRDDPGTFVEKLLPAIPAP